MRLWKKTYKMDKQILDFCTGDDYILDRHIIKYDARASIAHASMLKKIRILNQREYSKLKKCLAEIEKLATLGRFTIQKGEEDVHTAIENYLVKKCGESGKKIHTARSRNDQVLAALRLYAKDKLSEVRNAILDLSGMLVRFARRNHNTPMPGYTHTRKAMLSSVALWATAFIEALLDDVQLWKTAYELNNQSPLGSAAGYGVTLSIDRRYTSKCAGFGKVQNNPLYVQNSRGKFESIILSLLGTIMFDLNKLATDIILFSSGDLGYFLLPDKFCTGSSIMPHKKNPDVLELVRAKYHVVLSYEFRIKTLISNLLSGYNRDLQLTKEPFVDGFETTILSLKTMCLIINELKVNKHKCREAITPDMLATYHALNRTRAGVPFRDAYKQAARNINRICMTGNIEIIIKTYMRKVGNPKYSPILSRIKKYRNL